MKIIGNILWWIFGGLEAAVGYFTGSLALAVTIVGIPFALQTFKIGLLCLWPFGSEVSDSADGPSGCIRVPLNILWIIFGGLWAWLMHVFFGLLLGITIVGIPFAKQHFKMAGLSLTPFGKDVDINL
jgi:uncharacterized membrane protein YccF (DUF307 family)